MSNGDNISSFFNVPYNSLSTKKARFTSQRKEKNAENLARQQVINFNRAADESTKAEALSKATSDLISGGSGVIGEKKEFTPNVVVTKEGGQTLANKKNILESKALALQQERGALEKVVAKKKLGKLGKKEGSKVDWADAGQKVAAGLISAAQEREKARIAQDTINRSLLRDQLDLSNASSARRGQALSGLRTALANYFR